jgi:hypothetical protein
LWHPTERFILSNEGIGPAPEVTQNRNTDVAPFMDDGASVLIVKEKLVVDVDGSMMDCDILVYCDILRLNIVKSNQIEVKSIIK